VTLDALVREAAAAGWEQRVVVGVPAGEPVPAVGGLPPERIHPLEFGGGRLPFSVPGMSDVMPYRSTRFSDMGPEQLDAYRSAWRELLGAVLERYRPDVIHAHHVWILGALIKDVAPDVPVVTQCHATGFRQMELCPHLAHQVREGCARNDRFLVPHAGHAEALRKMLGVPAERVRVVGPGYRQDLFRVDPGVRRARPPRLVYAGKYCASKGLPWLLDAFEELRRAFDGELELHVAGSGAGAEAEELAARMAATDGVVEHGRLDQARLADLMRTGSVFVLPSFYEGVPLVLVEAAACGCRLVSTDLPGVRHELLPVLGELLHLVELPRLEGIDRPDPRDLGELVRGLQRAIEEALARGPAADGVRARVERLSWSSVFRRVEKVWRST
jgi:glycosyltransferase involved in cell wall biosynthesis